LGWSKSCIDVKGRLCAVLVHGQIGTAVPIWPWNSTAVTVDSAPDDGHKGRPKHVEHTRSC